MNEISSGKCYEPPENQLAQLVDIQDFTLIQESPNNDYMIYYCLAPGQGMENGLSTKQCLKPLYLGPLGFSLSVANCPILKRFGNGFSLPRFDPML